MNKKVEKGQATRAALMDAAAGLFATRGYADVSIDDVLAETGVSRGALYHHFPGKEALFLAVFEAMEARIARRNGGPRPAARQVRPPHSARAARRSSTWPRSRQCARSC